MELERAIANRDSSALARMSGAIPVGVSEEAQAKATNAFNSVFKQLLALFPAMASQVKTQDQLNELRRQWVMALAENDVFSKPQIDAGMKQARQHESAFLPSPGQFVAWCRDGAANAHGLPTDSELFQSVMRFRAMRHQFDSAEAYPWENNAQYWLVTAVSAAMTSRLLTETESLAYCREQLKAMAKRISNGEEIPKPIIQIAERYQPADHQTALNHIAKLKSMLKPRA